MFKYLEENILIRYLEYLKMVDFSKKEKAIYSDFENV